MPRPTDDELRALLDLEAKALRASAVMKTTSSPSGLKQLVFHSLKLDDIYAIQSFILGFCKSGRAIVEELLERRKSDRNADGVAAELRRWNGEE